MEGKSNRRNSDFLTGRSNRCLNLAAHADRAAVVVIVVVKEVVIVVEGEKEQEVYEETTGVDQESPSVPIHPV